MPREIDRITEAKIAAWDRQRVADENKWSPVPGYALDPTLVQLSTAETASDSSLAEVVEIGLPPQFQEDEEIA